MDIKHIKTPNRLLELDVLRGLAALAVVFFHYTTHSLHSGPSFAYGATGVEFFFMISGFVIFMSINKLADGKEFIANRIARLYPTYITCVTLTFLLQAGIALAYFHKQVTWQLISQYLVNLTMFQYYFKVDNLDGPYWTLIVEMVFYIVIYLMFVSNTLKYIQWSGTILMVVFFAVAYLNPGLFRMLTNWTQLISFWGLFLAGIVFYQLYIGQTDVYKYLVLALCYCYELYQHPYRVFADYHVSVMEYAVILLSFFAFFMLFIKNKLGFLVSRFTVFLGTISYALYLLHAFIGTSFFIPLFTNKLHINFWLSMLITLTIVIAMAGFITFYIEVPLRSRLRKRLRQVLGLEQRNKITP